MSTPPHYFVSFFKKEMFAELRESLARAKCDESSLEISRIFSVFSRMQDRGAFLEARIAQVGLIGQATEFDSFGYTLRRDSALEATLGESYGFYSSEIQLEICLWGCSAGTFHFDPRELFDSRA